MSRKKVKDLILKRDQINRFMAKCEDMSEDELLSNEEYFDIETEYFRIEKRLDELSLLGYYAKGYEDDKTIKFTF